MPLPHLRSPTGATPELRAAATRRARAYAALPLGWAALLLYLTLAPADRLPPQPRWELLSFDTFAHAAFFAVQAGLTWLWLRRQTRWPAREARRRSCWPRCR